MYPASKPVVVSDMEDFLKRLPKAEFDKVFAEWSDKAKLGPHFEAFGEFLQLVRPSQTEKSADSRPEMEA
jgi:hypothetical protein